MIPTAENFPGRGIPSVLALVLVALPVAAFLGVFMRLPLLLAVAVAVVIAAVVAALSPAFREWLHAEVDDGFTCNGLRLATGIAMSPNHSWARITSDETWVTSSPSLSPFSGTAIDTGGGDVASVEWANNRGGGGTATGTTAWSVPSLLLQSGENILTVTVTGE